MNINKKENIIILKIENLNIKINHLISLEKNIEKYYSNNKELKKKIKKINFLIDNTNKNKKDKDNNKFTMDDISISENEDKPTKYFTDDNKNDEILNKLGLNKMCCRRHMLSHVDLIQIIS